MCNLLRCSHYGFMSATRSFLAVGMAAASAVTSSSISTSLWQIRRNSTYRVSTVLFSSSPSSSPEHPPPPVRGNYTGIKLAETVELGFEKTRVDSWISSRIPGISRARVQSSIRSGLASVNGRIINKVTRAFNNSCNARFI